MKSVGAGHGVGLASDVGCGGIGAMFIDTYTLAFFCKFDLPHNGSSIIMCSVQLIELRFDQYSALKRINREASL